MLPPNIGIVSKHADDVLAQKIVEPTQLTTVSLTQNFQAVFVCWRNVNHYIVCCVVATGDGARPIVAVEEPLGGE